MKHPERVSDYLEHMLVACNRVAATVEGMTRESFLEQWSPPELVIRQIIVAGEAAKRIERDDPEFFVREPILRPSLTIAMRNRVIHEYDEVDLGIVWTTAIHDFPTLRSNLIEVLARLRPGTDLDSLHF
jgi:uncharacterized protein with HEPN domain